MKDKIREFLAHAGGRASASAIAQQVLQLTHASPVTAERVLSSLLQGDPQFASDGMGNWHLLHVPAAVPALAVKVLMVGTPMRAQEVMGAKRLVLGWVPFAETSDAPVETAEIWFSPEPSPDEEIYRRMSHRDFAVRFAGLFEGSVIISWQPHAIAQAWRRIFAEHEMLPLGTVSLPILARNLLRLNRRPALPALYRQLCGVQNWRESFADTLQAQVEILRLLLARCREQGLGDWFQIAAYARRPRTTDFSSYAFDEKYIEALPELPGVYLMRNAANRVLYVGKAANLRARVRSYFQNPEADDRKLKQLQSQMFTLDYTVVDTELDALLLENRLIRRLNPQVNRQRKIFAAARPQSRRLQGIFLAPVHPSAPTATKGRVIVYLLSSRSLQRLSVRLGRKPGKRLQRALATFFGEISSSPEAGDGGERLEIAARWFQQNAASLNALDPSDTGDPRELENRLHALLRTPEILSAKFHIAAAAKSAASTVT